MKVSLKDWQKNGWLVEHKPNRQEMVNLLAIADRDYHLDDTTLVKFRARLRDTGMMEKVWAEVDKALAGRGVSVKRGVIVDSTLVASARRPESKKEDGEPVDKDAGYTSRKGQAIGGYKVHVGMDDESRLIRRIELSHIAESDHNHFASLIPAGADRVWVYICGLASNMKRSLILVQP